MSLLPASPSTLLDLLTSPPDGSAAVLPTSTGTAPATTVRPRGGSRRQLVAPVVLVARAVLRRPRIRQLALRFLKRFPGLYARAYRMMMAPGAGAPMRDAGRDPSLSPRAVAILHTLQQPPRTPGQRPRLALVSPLPPERTGIATYAVELLGHLRAWFDVELVLAQDAVTLPPALAGLPQHSVTWFTEHGGQFDHVLYQVGNSPFHSHMFALLARYPGVVVLHDFFLGGALAHAQMSGAVPGGWTEALFHSHGYEAVRASEDPQRNAQAHKDWPCSLGVLELATRVIVHSHYARQLAIDWYGAVAADNIDVIPHPRTPPAVNDRAAARAALGIPADCFLVCSFGFVAPNKLTHELLRAWTGSTLHHDARCALVLVGANHDSPYGVRVDELRDGAHISIAGWTDDAVYRQYLQAADLGVQLRTNAHGESSGAVLDCLNYGLPTIVNANGSMAEFPADAVWRLPDAFHVAELGAAMEALWHDSARRTTLSQRARSLINTQFRPDQCAQQYGETLERAHAARPQPGTADPRLRAIELAQSLPALRRQLLFDISDWAQPGATPDPLASNQLRELLAHEPVGLGIEPVWLDTTLDAPRYREARNATGRLLGLGWAAQPEMIVDVHAGDIYYAPDAASPAVSAAAQAGLFSAWRARGATVNLLVRGAMPETPPAGVDRLLHLAGE